MVETSTKSIFITGCSSGVGYHAAILLKKRGHHVIASCRKSVDVEKLKNLGLETIQMDVADASSIAEGVKQLLMITRGRLDVLINNAGYGQAGALEDVPLEALKAQFNTNVFGLMELTRWVIPIMRSQGNGRIINISSLLGVVSLPFRGAYNASKYAVEGLSDTLRLELKPDGIDVITFELGPIESRFREHAIQDSLQYVDIEHSHFKSQYQSMLRTYKTDKNDSIFTKDADVVVRKLIRAIEAKNAKTQIFSDTPSLYSYYFKTIS